jgi:hypothetical protein
MKRRLRLCFAAALLAAGAAHAQMVQTQTAVSPALEVQRLAPQLVAFAGSDVNFQNLVNGLALGLPVTLSTPLPGGATQLVSFTPGTTMTPLQIAQTLEAARQAAIANGIAAPTAQQLGVLLNGGALPTALGTTNVNPLVTGTSPVSTSLATQIQSTPRSSRSESPLPRGISDTPLGPPLSASTGATAAAGAGGATATTAAPSLEAPHGTAPATPARRMDR